MRPLLLFVCIGLLAGCAASEEMTAVDAGGGAGGMGGSGGTGGMGNQPPPPPPCRDLDQDGYQDRACNPNSQRGGGDCNDMDALINPGRMENCANMIDNDCNGRVPDVDPACGSCADLDGDGYQTAACNADPNMQGGDCDDQDPNVNPGAMERCGNFKDDDCQGGDVPCLQNCMDRDLDGFGEGSGCRGPDCDDNAAQSNPWQSEICGDNIDQDCTGEDLPCPDDCLDMDKDGFGEGSGCLGTDCDDNDPNRNPGASERPDDGIDQDCNGSDLVLADNCRDLDQDGYGEGAGCIDEDCDDGNPRINRGRTEICGNGVDDDCLGGDRTCVRICEGPCVDMDGDGFGMGACPRGCLDCDDNNPDINPNATETCNGIDDNCNDEIDECSVRNQVCSEEGGGECVGQAGAPCRMDNECITGNCNDEARSCRIDNGEICEESGECNPTAECVVIDSCEPEKRCYQAKAAACESDCDCTGSWVCHEANQRCVECLNDEQCMGNSPRDTCMDGGYCGEFASVGGAGNDARNQALQMVINCWDRFAESNEPQGCAILAAEDTLEVGGAAIAGVGDADALEDFACDRDAVSAAGFNGDETGILRELFGCGAFDVYNIWWPNALSAGDVLCVYYAPIQPGFGFPDDTRPAVVVDRCDLSSFVDND